MIQKSKAGFLQIIVQLTAVARMELARIALNERLKLQKIAAFLCGSLLHGCLLMPAASCQKGNSSSSAGCGIAGAVGTEGIEGATMSSWTALLLRPGNST